MDNKLTEDDINNIIEEVDEDGSGTLDFDGDDYDDNDEVYDEDDYRVPMITWMMRMMTWNDNDDYEDTVDDDDDDGYDGSKTLGFEVQNDDNDNVDDERIYNIHEKSS